MECSPFHAKYTFARGGTPYTISVFSSAVLHSSHAPVLSFNHNARFVKFRFEVKGHPAPYMRETRLIIKKCNSDFDTWIPICNSVESTMGTLELAPGVYTLELTCPDTLQTLVMTSRTIIYIKNAQSN